MTFSARTRAFRRVLFENLETPENIGAPSPLPGPSDLRAWLARHFPETPPQSFSRAQFFSAYAGATRRLGTAEIRLVPSWSEDLGTSCDTPAPIRRRDDLARAALIASALDQTPESQHRALVEEIFQRGDNLEREALLRTLSVLPGPERFVALATEASRTSVTTVFLALALDNPYPARFFPDASYAQLVLKALFLELPAAKIQGLAPRVGPELIRMLTDYERERRAAGRSIPRDLDVIRNLGAQASSEPERGISA